jgi:hypothetical protein
MSRVKQRSDVEDMSNPQTTHGSVGPTDPFRWCTGKSITNLYRLEALLWTESFEKISDIPRTLRILYTGTRFCKKRQRYGRNIGRVKIY